MLLGDSFEIREGNRCQTILRKSVPCRLKISSPRRSSIVARCLSPLGLAPQLGRLLQRWPVPGRPLLAIKKKATCRIALHPKSTAPGTPISRGAWPERRREICSRLREGMIMTRLLVCIGVLSIVIALQAFNGGIVGPLLSSEGLALASVANGPPTIRLGPAGSLKSNRTKAGNSQFACVQLPVQCTSNSDCTCSSCCGEWSGNSGICQPSC